MTTLFLLFSHQLSDKQKFEAKTQLGIRHFVSLPKDLQQLWSNIPPELTSLITYLEPLQNFLQDKAKANDVVLIQGEMGATYIMVNTAKVLGIKPIYATTKRVVKEKTVNGKQIKTSEFEHILFRRYE